MMLIRERDEAMVRNQSLMAHLGSDSWSRRRDSAERAIKKDPGAFEGLEGPWQLTIWIRVLLQVVEGSPESGRA